MTRFLFLAFCLAFESSLLAQTVGGPLEVNLVPNWTVSYMDETGPPTYSFTGPTDPKTKLGTEMTFSFYPQTNPSQIPGELQDIGTKAVASIQSNHQLTVLTGTYTKGDIKGDVFTGQSVTVSWLEKGEAWTHSQTFFIFSDSAGLWIGQYAGPPERWSEALKMTQGLKKKD